ncbi:MAG: MipA/OmpV family protein [Pseudomonadota bacterium]
MMRFLFRLVVPGLAVLALAGGGAAAVAQASDGTGPQNFVALGVGFGPEYLGSEDGTVGPFFAGRYDAGPVIFESRGTSLAADLLGPRSGGAFSAGPLARYRFGRDDVDNAVVDRLADVDGAVELGLFASYAIRGLLDPADALAFRLEAAFDVSDGHDGAVVTPSVSYSAPITDRLRATVSVSADYGDDSFHEAFFGVDAAGSVASGLPGFDAEAGFYSAGVSFAANYAFTETWGVTGLISYSRLLGDAEDSPVVDLEGDANQVFGGLGVVYRF